MQTTVSQMWMKQVVSNKPQTEGSTCVPSSKEGEGKMYKPRVTTNHGLLLCYCHFCYCIFFVFCETFKKIIAVSNCANLFSVPVVKCALWQHRNWSRSMLSCVLPYLGTTQVPCADLGGHKHVVKPVCTSLVVNCAGTLAEGPLHQLSLANMDV